MARYRLTVVRVAPGHYTASVMRGEVTIGRSTPRPTLALAIKESKTMTNLYCQTTDMGAALALHDAAHGGWIAAHEGPLATLVAAYAASAGDVYGDDTCPVTVRTPYTYAQVA